MNTLLKAIIKGILSRFGLRIQRLPSPGSGPIQLWEEDERFNALLDRVTGHTVVDKVRCFMIYQFVRQVGHIQGDIAEVGVFRGGTARILAEASQATDKLVHLFDTFSGMPPTDPAKDLHREGDFGDTSLEQVRDYLYDCDKVRFYPGLFPDTAKPLEALTFSLVHVDTDIYRSVKDCCEWFYPRLRPGGIMVFDDYGFPSCPGAKLAVEEFFMDKPEKPFYLQTGQCFVIAY